jgi:glycosyltransferase involved in cell wall biosynthesis
MRALHVAAGNLYGGVERILVEIARARGSWQHEFAVSFEGRLSSELRAVDASCHSIQPVRFSRPPTVWRARRHLRRVMQQPYDAVVCHSPWAYALAAPAAIGRRVLWAHDALRGSHWTERRVSRTVPDLVIANSHYTAGVVDEWLRDVPIEVVYAPVSNGPVDEGARAAVREELGVDSSTTVIVIAARFERWKGHAELIDAVAGLTGDWRVWIAGGAQKAADAALERELRSRVDDRGLTRRVSFLGERRDVPRLLKAADVHCQPNNAPEPFGVAFIEALDAGLPVVTTDAGGAREIVTAQCGVLLPVGDQGALRNALQTLIDDPAERASLGAAGPARARALTDPTAQMAALERVLLPPGAAAVA